MKTMKTLTKEARQACEATVRKLGVVPPDGRESAIKAVAELWAKSHSDNAAFYRDELRHARRNIDPHRNAKQRVRRIASHQAKIEYYDAVARAFRVVAKKANAG